MSRYGFSAMGLSSFALLFLLRDFYVDLFWFAFSLWYRYDQQAVLIFRLHACVVHFHGQIEGPHKFSTGLPLL